MKKVTNTLEYKSSYQILMHKKAQQTHTSKSSSSNRQRYATSLKTVVIRVAKLSTQMGMKKAEAQVLNWHIHISTVPSITTSYLNIYLIDLIPNPMGIKKRVKNKVNYC